MSAAPGTAWPLATHPVHLGLGARALPQPEFTDMAWYADYAARTEADGSEGRLVAVHRFDASWTSWEMHPLGDEVVYLIAGRVELIQELPGGEIRRVALSAGEYAINTAHTWHTMNLVDAPAEALFITAGQDTQHKPR